MDAFTTRNAPVKISTLTLSARAIMFAQTSRTFPRIFLLRCGLFKVLLRQGGALKKKIPRE